MRCIICFLAISFVVQAQVFGKLVPAAAYFVDLANGSDSNAGTSPSQSFGTLAKGCTTVSNGQMLAVTGGDDPNSAYRYREQCTIAAVGVSVVGYGASSPIVDASDAIAAGAWTLTNGTTSTYQATLTVNTPSATDAYVRVWENGAFMVRQSSTAGVDATPSSYAVSSDTTSPFTLYVHATTGSPATNGASYDYSSRQFGMYVAGVNGFVDNIVTQRNYGGSGSIVMGGINGTVANAIAKDGNKHNVFVTPPFSVYNVTAQNSYYPVGGSGSSTMFVYNAPVGNGQNGFFVNCTATRANVGGADTTNEVGFYGHTNTSGSFGSISFIGTSATGDLASAYSGANTTSYVLSGATTSGLPVGVAINDPAATSVTISGSTISSTGTGVNLGSLNNADVTISNTTLAVTGGFSARDILNGQQTKSLTVSGSTFNGSFGIYHCSSVINVQHNTFNNTDLYYNCDSTFGVPGVSDFNSFASASGNRWNINSTSSNKAGWITATGLDTHSTP